MRHPFAALSARPRLAAAMALGAAAGGACAVLAPEPGAALSALVGWNAFCFAYLGLTLHAVAGQGPAEIRVRAAQQDQGRLTVLLLILAACVISLAAVALELSQARQEPGLGRLLRIAGAVVTLTASWLTMQTVFAVHYAHEYYTPHADTGADRGGLAFPGGEAPDYWDFLHFAVVIGVAAQTADVAFTSKALRRLGTAHSLIAFVFNTLILALTINLLAGLL
ncbi:DUF1345 domain-containing protein [Phenylobacterium sp.]|uniref:DUF1345 domain-containing protein n=1 Tax=Phenylobacterium sp. TaxID=1871053 RepID=UPI00301CF7C8